MSLRSALGLLAMASALVAAPARAASTPPDAHAEALSRADLYAQELQRDNLYAVRFPDLDTTRRAAISFHGALLESDYAHLTLVLELDPEDVARLTHDGYVVTRATDFIARRDAMIARLQRAGVGASLIGRHARLPADVVGQSIPGYTCYETVEETFAAAQAIVAAHPTLATWSDAGDSWQKAHGLGGYDMMVLKLANQANTRTDKPKLLITSAIHAREYTTAPLALAFAQSLVDGYGTDPDATWILDHHEIHLMLQTNPDCRKQAEAGLLWRKNTDQAYCGATSVNRGADLNRNFTYSWNDTGGVGSSGQQCNETYRGAAAGSEPEVQAVEAYARAIWPDRRGPAHGDAAPSDTSGMHLDLHSYSSLVLWPWGDTKTPAANGPAMQTLGRKFAWFNGYSPMQSYGLYPTDGTSDGVSYGELGVPALTFELGTSFFESCATYTGTIKPKNLPALLYAAKVLRTPYVTPGGPDTSGLRLKPDASTTPVAAGTSLVLRASATDTHFNNSNGTEPVQAIAAAEYYVDNPPWEPGAKARAMKAADGAFNASTEALKATIPTAGLASGAHLVFVRAQDAGGTWGAFSAIFVRIQ